MEYEKKKKNDPLAQQKRIFVIVAIFLCIVILLGLFLLLYALVVIAPANTALERTKEAIEATNYSGGALINEILGPQTMAAETQAP